MSTTVGDLSLCKLLQAPCYFLFAVSGRLLAGRLLLGRLRDGMLLYGKLLAGNIWHDWASAEATPTPTICISARDSFTLLVVWGSASGV